MPEVMRQGIEELVKYENREERVYTKDQAFQRYGEPLSTAVSVSPCF